MFYVSGFGSFLRLFFFFFGFFQDSIILVNSSWERFLSPSWSYFPKMKSSCLLLRLFRATPYSPLLEIFPAFSLVETLAVLKYFLVSSLHGQNQLYGNYLSLCHKEPAARNDPTRVHFVPKL